MALSFIMVLCLLVYRLAEVRLRSRLVQTQQTIPDQVHKPTAHPTMRWVFQCFEGIELLHIQTPTTSRDLVLRLQPLHRLILQLILFQARNDMLLWANCLARTLHSIIPYHLLPETVLGPLYEKFYLLSG